MRAVKRFFLCRYGSGYGFRYRDPDDYSSAANDVDDAAATDQVIGTGTGSVTTFQLKKTYSDEQGFTFLRIIIKPVSGSVKVAVNGVELTTGWTVNVTTGVVSFATAPSNGAQITAGFEFDVPVRFGADIDPNFATSIDDFDQASVPSIPLREILSGTPVPRTTTEPGGANEVCPEVEITIDLSARLWIIQTNFIDTVFLPDPETIPMGGPVFYVVNAGPDDLHLKLDDMSTTLISLGVDEVAEVLLTQDASGNLIWYAI